MSENVKNKSATTKGVEDKSAAKKDKDKDADKKAGGRAGSGQEEGISGAAQGGRARPPYFPEACDGRGAAFRLARNSIKSRSSVLLSLAATSAGMAEGRACAPRSSLSAP